MYLAVEKIHFKIMQKLLEYGADPKVLNKNGQTILHLATKYRDTDLAQRLLDQGISPNI